jgi:hypothetical protein
MSEYQRDQIQDVLKHGSGSDDFYRMKVMGRFESKWFNVSPEQLAAIRDVLEPKAPRIEILTVRDPDSSTDVRMWVDGVETSPYVEESVDPGAGHQLGDWLGAQVDVLLADSYSEAFKTAALEAYEAFDGSSYIEGDLTDAEISCYHAEGSFAENTRTYCDWTHPVEDIHIAAAALRSHRRIAHPEK